MKDENFLLLRRENSLTTSPFNAALPMSVEGGAAAVTLMPIPTCSNACRIRSCLVPAVVAVEVDAIVSVLVTAAARIATI